MKKISAFFLFLLFFFWVPYVHAELYQHAEIVHVSDGDTVKVRTKEASEFVCRLYGIDAPETKHPGKPAQALGDESANFLKQLLSNGKDWTIETTGDKTYGREVCLISIYTDVNIPSHFEPSKSSSHRIDINLEMVRNGYAWAYRKYLRDNSEAATYIAASTRGLPCSQWENFLG